MSFLFLNKKEILFNELYDKYKNLVYKIAHQYLTNSEDCDDCFQDVFAIVWKKIDKFTELEESHKKNLICTIAKGIAIDKLRRNSVVEKHDEYLIENEAAENALDVVNIASLEDLKAVMKACLTEREQNILILRFYHNFTNKEIAEMYGIKPVWTSKLISRALSKIKESLGDDYFE